MDDLESIIVPAIRGPMGYALIGVHGTMNSPSFTYSIGASKLYGYEVLMLGLRSTIAAIIINDLMARVKAKELRLVDGLNVPDAAVNPAGRPMPALFKLAIPAKVEEYVTIAIRHFGVQPPFLQILMPDRAGLLPGDPRFDHDYMDPRQPLLY
jgi:hypothetical protein